MVSHTVKSLRDKLNELIINGYENYPVAITYDNEHGVKITKNISEDIDQHDKELYPMKNPLWGWETKTDDKRYQLRLELIQIPDNEVNIPMINIPVSLLEDIRHELVTLNGLEAFDGDSEHVVRSATYKGDIHDLPPLHNKRINLPLDDIIQIDTNNTVKKIDEWLA